MKKEMIGNKDSFAVEFVIDYNHSKNGIVYGGCRLWLKGSYLGDIGEHIYLNMFFKTLKWLGYNFNKENFVDALPLFNLSSKDFGQWRADNEERLEQNAILRTAGFDSFSKLCFKKNEHLLFYWCVYPDVLENSEDYPRFKDYPKEVQMAEITISTIREVADKFEARINEIIDESAMS